MHSSDVGHAAPSAWRGFAPNRNDRPDGPGQGHRRHDHDWHRGGAPSSGQDFARNVVYERVVSALRAQYGTGQTVPVAGSSSADAVTQGLANAAAQAFGRGGFAIASLRDAVDTGLSDATSQLQSLGIGAEDVAGLAADLRSKLEAFIGAAGQGAVAAAGARFSQKQKTEIEIVTQEGDTVRLSLRSRAMVAVGGVAANGSDGTASKAAATVIAGSKFEISVEGNLNDDEIAAIRDVLTKVEDLADDFFAGDVQAAFEAASNLDIDGDQLASVALELKLKQRLSAAGFLSQPVSTPAPIPTPAPTAPPVEASPPPASAPVVDVPDVPPPQAADEAAEGDTPPATDPAPTTPPPEGEPLPDASAITSFLMDLLDSLQDAGSSGSFSVSWRFKLEMLYSVVTTRSVEEPASQVATAKLGDTLGALS